MIDCSVIIWLFVDVMQGGWSIYYKSRMFDCYSIFINMWNWVGVIFVSFIAMVSCIGMDYSMTLKVIDTGT